MKLLDTDILFYSMGREHVLRKPCVDLLSRAEKEEIAVNIDTETLQELLYVYHRRGETGRAIEAFDQMIKLFPSPFAVTVEVMAFARHILKRHPKIESRDAVHAGVVMHYKLEGIVSVDKHYERVDEIRRFDPREIVK